MTSELIAQIVDVLLVIGLLGLWGFWWQQSRQRQQVEKKLQEASSQLQQACELLDQAMQQIQHLQSSEQQIGVKPAKKSVSAANKVAKKTAKAAVPASPPPASPQGQWQQNAYKVKPPVMKEEMLAPVEAADSKVAKNKDSRGSQATQVLRLHREGMQPESIAEQLGIPLAQVKLLLMLQSSQRS